MEFIYKKWLYISFGLFLLLLSFLTRVDIVEKKPIARDNVIQLNQLKAFPTAQGAGAIVSGGRGGKVIYVTTLSDSGAGSLREALLNYGKEHRTILFAVGGRFKIDDEIYSTDIGNFTLAGQTANDLGGVHLIGEGSELKKHKVAIYDSENFSVRYISAKGLWQHFAEQGNPGGAFVLDLSQSNKVIVDHFSGGYGCYMLGFDKYNPNTKIAGEFTLQYSLGHEGVAGHNVVFPTGFSYTNVNASLPEYQRSEAWNHWVKDYDVHHNAYILVGHRQPVNTSGGRSGSFVLTSNYTYSWGSRLSSHRGSSMVDLINNVAEKGNYAPILLHKLYKIQLGTNINTTPVEPLAPSLYASGNEILAKDGSKFIRSTDNQWQLFTNATTTKGYGKANEAVNTKYQRLTPQVPRLHPVTITPADKVKERVLANAGAGVRFNTDGSTYNIDEIDSRYIQIAKNNTDPDFVSKNTKPPFNKSDGGIGDPARFIYPVYPSKSRSLKDFDSDLDGLPNDWEQRHGVTDANEVVKNWKIQGYKIINNAGYTNLEMYLAEIAGDFHMLAKQKKLKMKVKY